MWDQNVFNCHSLIYKNINITCRPWLLMLITIKMKNGGRLMQFTITSQTLIRTI